MKQPQRVVLRCRCSHKKFIRTERKDQKKMNSHTLKDKKKKSPLESVFFLFVSSVRILNSSRCWQSVF